MNRMRALLTAGITTALSAAAIAATATAQGVFSPGGGEPAPQVSVSDSSQPTETVVRELPPIVVQAGTSSDSLSNGTNSAGGVSTNSTGGRNGADDGPLHDVGDDKGGLRDGDDERSGHDEDDDDDDDRHGDDDDRHSSGHGDDDDD
jgi:hypothetical protein